MQQPLLIISCKEGSLRVTRDGFLVIVNYPGKPIWQIPVQGVTVTEVSRKIMAKIEIRSPQGTRLVEWIAPTNIPKLQQALVEAQQASYLGTASYSPTAPTYPYTQNYQQAGVFGPPLKPPGQLQRFTTWYRTQSRPVQVVVGIVLVACTLFVGSAMCTGAVQGVTASFAPTPTVASSASGSTQQVAQVSTPTIVPTPTDTPTPKPTATPTPKPKPTPTTPVHTGVNGNPWGYDFTPGNLIYNPPATFCDYFACIANFWNGRGYVNECNDATYSKSGGISGDCSHHGGKMRPLYSH